MRRWVFIVLGLIVVAALAYGIVRYVHHVQNQADQITTIITPPPSPSPSPTPTITLVPTESVTNSPTPTPIPATPAPTPTPTLPSAINLDVPFTIQAPTQNWDALHEETCEEATMLMAQYWSQHKSGVAESGYKNRIPPATADAALQASVDWEKANLGGTWKDTTADQTIQLAKGYYHVSNIDTISNPTADQIKQALAAGNLVVAPTAGQLLNNPHFTAPGPVYHMIVIRGYTGNSFITNDPGIREGEGYVYPITTFMNAIHDWNGSESAMLQGQKIVIVVHPQT